MTYLDHTGMVVGGTISFTVFPAVF